MLDLEEHVGRVWNPDIRPLVAEAYRCYASGAARASITLTWVAVCADLIEKVNRLAEDDEAAAAELTARIERARDSGADAQAVQAMQEVERTILDKALELELIDTIGQRELERLREDRHLCAHPSLRPLGEFYEPRIEYARAHLAVALDVLLIHPPSQGRKVIDRFRAHVTESSFVESSEHLTHVFYDLVRPATRRRIVDLAVKHAVLELDAPDPPGAVAVADRMTTCVLAFASRDRGVVRDAVRKVVERFRNAEGAIQLRALGRLGDLDVFWDAVDDPMRSRLERLIRTIPLPDRFAELHQDHAAVLSLVALDEIRGRMPVLQGMFGRLSASNRAIVVGRRPGPYFAPFIPQLLGEASSFRGAEFITQQAVIPCGPYLTLDQLSQALRHWAANEQCRIASRMLELSLEFYAATVHLRPADKAVWQSFITDVQNWEEPGSPYCYTELEAVING
jgi:hypothetical protein